MRVWVALLAFLGLSVSTGWAAPPVAWEVRDTEGVRRICWEPPPASDSLDGPIDRKIVVGELVVWGALRCLMVEDGPLPMVRWSDEEAFAPVRPAGAFLRAQDGRQEPWVPRGVQDATRSADGNLWFALCNRGVARLDPFSRIRRIWGEDDGMPPGCVTQIETTSDGYAWAITPDRAVKIHPRAGPQEIIVFDPEQRASVSAILTASDGTVWLGGQAGRLRSIGTSPERERRYPPGAFGISDRIAAISEGRQGDLWLTSPGRLTRINLENGRYDVLTSGNELPPGRLGRVIAAGDGLWVVVRTELGSGQRGGLLRLNGDGSSTWLDLPGMPAQPHSVIKTQDDALWISDERGLYRVSPKRDVVRLLGPRDGTTSGLPWMTPASPSGIWGVYQGTTAADTLSLLSANGEVQHVIEPAALPSPGNLLHADNGVLLAAYDGLWALNPNEATWTKHPGFGEIRGMRARALRVVHTGASGQLWLGGTSGLRVGSQLGSFEEATPPGAKTVFDVLETLTGTTLIATDAGLFARDRLGRMLRVVDDLDRPVTGVSEFTKGPTEAVWAWGEGGAWTVEGTDAIRQMSGPVHDLQSVDGQLWVIRRDLRVMNEEKLELREIPRRLGAPRQAVIRNGAPLWIRTTKGLWRNDGTDWVRAVGVDGPLLRSKDGTLWRWDPDGLHVLPPDAATWRWVGLPAENRRATNYTPTASPPISADLIHVQAIEGVLAVSIEGRIYGDPLRPDPIVDIDVRGTRWAALSRRGVLLRGEGYRLLEQSYVPGPARRVALGPHTVCVAGTTVWCRNGQQWERTLPLLALPAPLPTVDVAVDDDNQPWSLHPGALCVPGARCIGLLGRVRQTSLLVHEGQAWIGSLDGLYLFDGKTVKQVWDESAVRDLAVDANGDLLLASDLLGVVRRTSSGEYVALGFADELSSSKAPAIERISVSQTGHIWVRQGGHRYLLPGPQRRDMRWPWRVAD